MKTIFDLDGHLTDDALSILINGNPDELTRLEIAEHLSFCDCCTERYTALLCEPLLLDPPDPLTPSVLRQIAQHGRVLFFHRYVAAGMAACLALAFWFTGMFDQPFDPPGEHYTTLYDMSERATTRTHQLGENLTNGLSSFFDQLSNLDLKGVFQDEKK